MKAKIVSESSDKDEYTIEYNDGKNIVKKNVKRTDLITSTYDIGAEVDIRRTILFPEENNLEILFSLGVLLLHLLAFQL